MHPTQWISKLKNGRCEKCAKVSNVQKLKNTEYQYIIDALALSTHSDYNRT